MVAALAFLLVFLSLVFCDMADIRGRKFLIRSFSFLVLLIFFSGNRFNGADWINYRKIYDSLGYFSNPFDAISFSPFEQFFSIFLWLTSFFNLPYEAVVFIVGSVNCILLTYISSAISKRSQYLILAFTVAIEGWALYHEQLRQSLAVSICLVAMILFLRKKFATSVFLWLFSIGFHSSAIIFPAIFYIARYVSLNNNKPLRLSAASLIVSLLYISIESLLFLLKSNLIPFFNLDRIQNKLSLYDQNDKFGGSLFTAGLIGYAITFLILLAMRKGVRNKSDFWTSLSWSISLLWTLLGPLLRSEAILIRFEHYFLIFLGIFFGLYFGELKRNMLGYFSRFIIIIFIFTFPLRSFLNPENIYWSQNYQNWIVYGALDLPLDDADLREASICTNLALFNNDFCGKAPD